MRVVMGVRLDPRIRGTQVRLDGAIVILDEAHNIEEVCRDAASCSVDDYEVSEAIRDVSEKSEWTGEYRWAELGSLNIDLGKELERQYPWISSDPSMQAKTLDKVMMLPKREEDDDRDKSSSGQDRIGVTKQVYAHLELVGIVYTSTSCVVYWDE